MINFQYIDKIAGNETTLKKQLLGQFIETTQEDLKNLNSAVSEKKVKEIIHYAHRIKGSSVLLDIKSMTDIADKLEHSSEELSQDLLNMYHKQLCDIFFKVKEQIQNEYFN